MRAPAVLTGLRRWAARRAGTLSFLLACLLRFPGLGHPDLSVDETWTWYVTDRVLATGEFWSSVSLGVDGPLFVAVNAISAGLFGLSVAALRAPQAIFGALSIPLLVSFLRRRHPALALPVGLLAAASPFLVFYAKDARPYSQLLFFTLLFLRAFDRDPGGRSWRRRLALSLHTVLAVSTHYFALVFFAAFYIVVLAAHALSGRRSDLAADFRTGFVTLLASLPFLLPLLAGAGSVSVPYWRISDVSLPGIVVEQFFFPGTSLSRGSFVSAVLNVLLAGLVVLPFAHAFRARSRVAEADPLFSIWWVAPLLVAVCGAVLGRDLLFYPRGFIPTTPLLLASWVAFTRGMSVSRSKRRAYVALVLAPFLIEAAMIAVSHPFHPNYRGRDVLADIARDVETGSEPYDVLLVHHWWMAQYFFYYVDDPVKVRPLGRDARAEEEVERLPPGARVLLVLNDLAAEHADPGGRVIEALESRRPRLAERPCLYPALSGAGLVCRRILLFGPADG